MKSEAAHLEELAIPLPAPEPAQYFFGDNLEGYHEGCAYRTAHGSGYWIEGQPLFRDFVPLAHHDERIRDKAREAVLLPHAIRHIHPGGSDECSILHRQRAVAMTVDAKRPTRLGIAPLFDGGAGEMTVTPSGPGFLLRFKHHRYSAALCATQPLTLDGPIWRGALPAAMFTTTRPVREVTAYLAFDRSPRRALARAEKLARENGRAAHTAAIAGIVGRSRLETSDPDYNRAVAWAKLTSYFLVTEEFGKGIWAGLPWFKNNWGRDTFIALPGTLLVTGMFDDARDVILNFLRYQDRNPKSPTYGRVPNRVASATDIIYNTTDGTPWLIRELYEYLQYTGDVDLARQVFPDIKLAITGAIRKFVDAEGFLTHDDADTWMDARIMGDKPWSARGNRANDIQALWHNALLIGVRLAESFGDRASARRWTELADRLKKNFTRRFWNARRAVLADRITADNRRDEKNRPNQLMVLSIPMIEPLLNDAQADAVVTCAVNELLYPYGIASLSQRDPYFHPYHHLPEQYHYDAAYHNGTVWGWNAGFAVSALCQRRQINLAARLAENLAAQILHLGCRGSMSELIEAIPRKRGELVLSGTWAQAWSPSEFARNAFQDFGGFNPRLLEGELHLHPCLPDHWEDLSASFPFGRNAALHVSITRWSDETIVHVRMENHPGPLTLCLTLDHGRRRYALEEPLLSDRPLLLRIARGKAWLNNRTEVPGQNLPPVKSLRFAKPSLDAKPPCLKKKDYLQTLIESGTYR